VSLKQKGNQVHSFKRCLLAASVVCVAAGLALVPAVSAGKTPLAAKSKNVHIGDDYYAPGKIAIRKGGQVHWIWNDTTFGSHNVTFVSGPKGISAAKFTSITASGGFKFTRKFGTPGTYHFICTVHRNMHMTVVVKH
jgi:plastocyanin